MILLPPRPLTSLFLPTLLITTLTSAINVEDFSFYPAATRSCMLSASGSSNCDQSSVAAYNACVCKNGGGFIDSAASCIAKDSPSDMSAVYDTLSRNCGESNTPVDYPKSKFLAYASSTKTTTSPDAPKTTDKPTTKISTLVQTIVAPTNAGGTSEVVSTVTLAPSAGQTQAVTSIVTFKPGETSAVTLSLVTVVGGSQATDTPDKKESSSDDSKLGTGAIVGIAVGVPVFFAFAGLLGFLLWRHRRSSRPPSYPGAGASTSEGYQGPHGGMGGAAVVAAHEKPRPESHYTNSSVGHEPGKFPPSPQPYHQTPSPQPYPPQHQQPYGQPPYSQYPQPQPQQYGAPYGHQGPPPPGPPGPEAGYSELGGTHVPNRVELQ